MTTAMTNNRLDEIRRRNGAGYDGYPLKTALAVLEHDIGYLLQLLAARPAVAGYAREVAEKAVNQIAVGAWQYCSRQWAIEMFSEALTTHAIQRYREEVEAAMKASCEYCRDGIELADNGSQHIWPGPSPRQWDYCEAVAIRALLQESE